MSKFEISLRQILLVLICFAGPRLWAQEPANDHFTNRVALSGTSVNLSTSNLGATEEPGEPIPAGRIGGSSVWWTWKAPADGQLQITTDGSGFDTILAIYVGTSLTNLNLLAGNDDHDGLSTSLVRFPTTQNTDYAIVVDGLNGQDGAISLSLSFSTSPISRPANDNFINRISLSGASVSTSGSNSNGTRELSEPLHASQFGDTSVWWSWIAPVAGIVRVSTAGSSLDTLLGVYVGSTISNLTLIANNDDEDPGVILTSTLNFEAIAGQTYSIAVDGFDGATGQISLEIGGTLSAAPTLTAPISLPDGSFQFTLTGPAGKTNEIQISNNLDEWVLLATIVNTNGTLVYTDATAHNSSRRLYRAMLK